MTDECAFKGQGQCHGILGLLIVEVDGCPPERALVSCEAHARKHAEERMVS